MRSLLPCFVFLLIPSNAVKAQEGIPLGDAIEHALGQSKLTEPGSKPFHLVAQIVETTNPKSEFRGEIEEFWGSPDEWHRTIESPGFSQVMIVDGSRTLETNKGDYFPWWLRDLVTALVDPVPNANAFRQVNAKVARATATGANSCVYLSTKIDRWSLCFDGRGLLSYVGLRGFQAEFREYKGFAGKQVARVVVVTPESGTTIEAKITLLEELSHPDDRVFAVDQATPLADRIRSVQIDQETVRRLATTSTEIEWPSVGGGPTKGGCGVYISVDRSGQVREVWPNGCDNAGLEDPLREIVKKWRLTPAIDRGSPVQIESLVTFSFDTTADSKKLAPELTNEEVRGLASNIVEPNFPVGSVERGKDVVVRISVDESGKLTGLENPQQLKAEALLAANAALKKWQFHPYLKDGKPQHFHADVVFHTD